MKTENRPPKHLKSVSFILLFAWISFFAPISGYYWRFSFIFPFLLVLLLMLFYLDRNFYKSVFNRKEVLFWIFLLTMIGGIINVKEPPVAYRHFWFFIFPIPFLFFFTKIAFKERCAIPTTRSICFLASLVCIYGIIELITGCHLVHGEYINVLYFSIFSGKRMISLHVHPAPLGTYLVAILPLAIMLLLKEKSTFFKSVAIIYSILIFIAVQISKT